MISKPESWNNLTVAYRYKGDYKQAAGLFQKTANARLETAVKNLDQYKRWFGEKDKLDYVTQKITFGVLNSFAGTRKSSVIHINKCNKKLAEQ